MGMLGRLGRKFFIMAHKRLELPCSEPLVEVCLPHEFRYLISYFHGLMYKMNSSVQLHCLRPVSELDQAVDT